MKPVETVIIDDMANVDKFMIDQLVDRPRIWQAPWRLGVAHAFNMGVALAPTECVIMLGADDMLDPECIEHCWYAYNHADYKELTYFALKVRFIGTDKEQIAACGGAMVTKSLWRATGGFPVESAVGASDTMLLSMIIGNPGHACIQNVNADKALYFYREHPETDTAEREPWNENSPWFSITRDVRNHLTTHFKPPMWGRYE